jgi:hypothetical protein
MTIRGKTYRIDELPAGDYEDEQRKAEIPNPDGEGTVTDMVLLSKLITLKATTIVEKQGDPPGTPLDPEAWAKEKYPVVSRIQLAARQAHFMALTDEERKGVAEQEKKRGSSPNS